MVGISGRSPPAGPASRSAVIGPPRRVARLQHLEIRRRAVLRASIARVTLFRPPHSNPSYSPVSGRTPPLGQLTDQRARPAPRRSAISACASLDGRTRCNAADPASSLLLAIVTPPAWRRVEQPRRRRRSPCRHQHACHRRGQLAAAGGHLVRPPAGGRGAGVSSRAEERRRNSQPRWRRRERSSRAARKRLAVLGRRTSNGSPCLSRRRSRARIPSDVLDDQNRPRVRGTASSISRIAEARLSCAIATPAQLPSGTLTGCDRGGSPDVAAALVPVDPWVRRALGDRAHLSGRLRHQLASSAVLRLGAPPIAPAHRLEGESASGCGWPAYEEHHDRVGHRMIRSGRPVAV